MTYKEQLMDQDFEDVGLCSVCGGAAWKYTKTVNNRYVEAKVYGHYKNEPTGRHWIERGDALLTISGNGKIKITHPDYLLNTLKNYKIEKDTAQTIS